jgi:hypothetical protein
LFFDEDSEDISDLEATVTNSRAMIFIFSADVFESEWSLLKLRAMAASCSSCKIVLLTQAGAQWEFKGERHDFPPQEIIPADVKQVFKSKGQSKRGEEQRRWASQVAVRGEQIKVRPRSACVRTPRVCIPCSCAMCASLMCTHLHVLITVRAV